MSIRSIAQRNGIACVSVLVVTALLAGCGGGGGSGQAAAAPRQQPPPSQFTPGSFQPSANFKDMCATPRTGVQFPDTQGTSTDENNWLRSWSNELYLWYDEIVDQNPANYSTPQYFELMKTTQVTPSGKPKDPFHFTLPTDEWEALAQSGISAGYGALFSVLAASPPREIAVAYTEANGPADAAGLVRGTRLLQVDGVSVANGADVDTLNAGLFPAAAGEDHVFVVQDPGAAVSRSVTLRSDITIEDPVRNVEIFDTSSGSVGYLFFTRHIAPSESQLIDAVQYLANAGVTDLVVDVRYNGGGFLDIANEFAYMIAGGAAASGRVFSELQFNDKHPVINPVTGAALAPDYFYTTTQGFSTNVGDPLPTLDLPRVFMLTGVETCSASEEVINGLRGIDVEVIQIGSPTCGKPYGYYATDNCGTTYFSIQFRSVNAKGFGDFADGFAPQNLGQAGAVTLPGCAVADDYGHPLGDRAESRLAAALDYRDGLGCPAVSQAAPVGTVRLLQKQGAAGAIATGRLPGNVKRR